MLDLIIKEGWFKAQATIGFWPANAKGDDIVVYADDTRREKIATFHTLRQQLEKREGRFNSALSDFIAPVSSGVPDYIGAFVVTAGIGEDVVADRFKNANDDYSSILCKALADRLAEAFAERMHARCAANSGAMRRTRRWRPINSSRAICRYSSGARLSRTARSHREGDAVHVAGCREHRRREADRKLRDVAGLVGIGALFQPPESFYFGVGRSSATRSKTTPRAKAGAWPRPSAGWRRC